MKIIDEILRKEGWPKYTDDPNDKGGPTKGGITLATLSAWRRDKGLTRAITSDDVRHLSEDEAREIYRERYVTKPGFSGIADGLLREQAVDAGVLQGTRWATRRLQELVGVKVDGKLGPLTLGAINRKDAEALNDNFTAARVKKLARIVKRDPSQIKWLVGWMDRAVSFLET